MLRTDGTTTLTLDLYCIPATCLKASIRVWGDRRWVDSQGWVHRAVVSKYRTVQPVQSGGKWKVESCRRAGAWASQRPECECWLWHSLHVWLRMKDWPPLRFNFCILNMMKIVALTPQGSYVVELKECKVPKGKAIGRQYMTEPAILFSPSTYLN